MKDLETGLAEGWGTRGGGVFIPPVQPFIHIYIAYVCMYVWMYKCTVYLTFFSQCEASRLNISYILSKDSEINSFMYSGKRTLFLPMNNACILWKIACETEYGFGRIYSLYIKSVFRENLLYCWGSEKQVSYLSLLRFSGRKRYRV